MKLALHNANYLKEKGLELCARGPLVDISFRDNGPIGIHIVNVTSQDENGKTFDRVVVASTSDGAQAKGRIFFGEQVMQVGDISTKGMRMKEVKLLIADAERPIRIVVQPLCIKGAMDYDFPMCPPISVGFEDGMHLWRLVSRTFALEESSPPRTVHPRNPFGYCFVNSNFLFVKAVAEEDKDLMELGDLVLCVDGKSGGAAAQQLGQAQFPGSEVVVQKVHVTGVITCPKCLGREWIFSNYCSHCGAPQKHRRS